MKCPNCSNSDFTFYPDDHIAYYDQFFGSWAEAMVYTCHECGYSEFMRQPQGTVLDNMGKIPRQLGQDLQSALGIDGGWIATALNAQQSETNKQYTKAAIDAYNFCLRKDICLDIIWTAWALDLAEKAGIPDLIALARRMYVNKCREYRRDYIRRSNFSYKKELVNMLDNEIDRLGTLGRPFGY